MEVAAVPNDFTAMRETFKPIIKSYFESGDLLELIKEYKDFSASETDKRLGFEQAIRDLFLDAWTKNSGDVETFKNLIGVCMEAAKNEMLTPQVSVTLLSDTFDTISVSVAEQLFHFVQDSLLVWKSDLFFGPCKNSILRMCNDLLRRLPRSDNIKFCGEVLLFLTLFFPFSERSGLNLVSEFNLENVTNSLSEPNLNLENDIIKDIVPDTLVSKVDGDFYKNFWGLQDFFRNPNQCYDDSKMKEFMEHTNVVLKLLANSKVPTNPKNHKFSITKNQKHCSKYLTGEKLLIYQLNDIHFRRILFLQYSMLFQYLKSDVKSKSESFKLDGEKLDWLKSTTISISKLAKESPFPRESPCNGTRFIKVANVILEREDLWNKWKNESCPPLKKKKPPAPREFASPVDVTSNSVADSVDKSRETNKVSTLYMGKVKEWSVKTDYLSKCKNFVSQPNLKKRVDEIMADADPSAMIEAQYKKVNDMKYVWQTLKLYNQKGPPRCFNSPAQAVPDKIPDYVEYLSKQISRDIAFKAMQARLKKQTEELRARQADQAKRLKGDEEDRVQNNHSKEVREEESRTEVEDDDEVEMIEEEVDLAERASSEEGASSSQESDDEDEEDEEEEEDDGDEDKDDHENQEENGNSNLKPGDKENGETANGEKSTERIVIPKDGLELIAKEITSNWPKLAEELGYKSDDIDFFAKEENEDFDRALNMLDVWFSNNEDTSAEHLRSALEAINLTKAAEIVLKYENKSV